MSIKINLASNGKTETDFIILNKINNSNNITFPFFGV